MSTLGTQLWSIHDPTELRHSSRIHKPTAGARRVFQSAPTTSAAEGKLSKLENLQVTKDIHGRRKTQTLPGEILDVSAAALFLGISEKGLRARVARRMIPFKRWGGRVCFLRAELLDFLRSLDGCSVDEALQNGRERSSDPEQDQLQTT